jgi:hypothetical protein
MAAGLVLHDLTSAARLGDRKRRVKDRLGPTPHVPMLLDRYPGRLLNPVTGQSAGILWSTGLAAARDAPVRRCRDRIQCDRLRCIASLYEAKRMIQSLHLRH